MKLEIQGNQVLQVEEVKTAKQIAIVKKHYDMVYHTVLSYDETNQKVKAEVYDYQNNFVEDFNDTIIFEFEGEQVEVQAVNGIAEIDFIIEVPETYTIKTANQNLRNGEVTINV